MDGCSKEAAVSAKEAGLQCTEFLPKKVWPTVRKAETLTVALVRPLLICDVFRPYGRSAAACPAAADYESSGLTSGFWKWGNCRRVGNDEYYSSGASGGGGGAGGALFLVDMWRFVPG